MAIEDCNGTSGQYACYWIAFLFYEIQFFYTLFSHLSLLFSHVSSVGDVVHMRVTETQDDTPLYSDEAPVSSFTGIRIAPLTSDP